MNFLEQLMLIWSTIACHSEESSPSPSVVVVGGGVAGLNAASKLHSAGYEVTLLEAMDRIGGRTHTKRLSNGEYVEMGGEWIMGETGNDLFNLAYPLGLVDDKADMPDLYKYRLVLPSGELLNSSVAEKFYTYFGIVGEDVYGWKKDVQVTNVGAWARYALEKFHEESEFHPDAEIREAAYDWAHRTMITDAAVRNWFNLSAKDEGEHWEAIEGNQIVTWKPPYSYSSLHQLILTGNVTEDSVFQLPEWIRLNEEVTSVEYSETSDKVTVVTRKGERLTADHVIFTPSLGVLKATHSSIFVPNLPKKKQLAIESLGFGCIMKIYMKFDKAWWPDNYEGAFLVWDDVDYTNPAIQWWRDDISREELLAEDSNGIPLWARSITAISNIHSGSAPTLFRAWLTGRSSEFLDDLDPSYVQEKVMLVVHKFLDASFPGKITEPTEIFWTKWYSNRFTRGTYSSRSTAADINDVWARDLASPIIKKDTGKPLVCFAGEATNPTHYATVHGAYETGTRESKRIISYYENLKND